MLVELLTWLFGLLGLGGVIWGGLRVFRSKPRVPVLPPPPAPDPAVVAEAAAREAEARRRARAEVVGPPTIKGAKGSKARLHDFVRRRDGE